jgi:hypothetical protein
MQTGQPYLLDDERLNGSSTSMGLTYHLQKKNSRKSATSQLGIPPSANKHNDELNADLSTKHVELRITTGGYNLY